MGGLVAVAATAALAVALCGEADINATVRGSVTPSSDRMLLQNFAHALVLPLTSV
eukprot:COSAG06_NODE_42465_length_381_cov_1.106383_1_plen_55_part_00